MSRLDDNKIVFDIIVKFDIVLTTNLIIRIESNWFTKIHEVY